MSDYLTEPDDDVWDPFTPTIGEQLAEADGDDEDDERHPALLRALLCAGNGQRARPHFSIPYQDIR